MNCNIIKLSGGRFRVESTMEDIDQLNSEILYQKGRNNFIKSQELMEALNKKS